jgi:diguanylate cyclase (GGDEF)-like protein/PAS domain S-box-containing protein
MLVQLIDPYVIPQAFRKMPSETNKLSRPYMLAVALAGGAALLFSLGTLDLRALDARFWFLAAVTVFFGSRVGIEFSKHRIQITVSDTFVFLTLLLFGGGPAVIVAGTEAFLSSLRFSKLWLTRFFNGGLLALSTYAAYQVTAALVGDPAALVVEPTGPAFVAAVSVMALAQYLANSSLAAIREAIKLSRRVDEVWREHFSWTSVKYLAGATAAAVTAKMIVVNGFYAFPAALPIIGIIYFTYRTYRKEMDAKSAQVEQAARHSEEQKAITQALRESEERFRSAFDHAAVGMALVAPDGRWLEVNPSLRELLGYGEEEISGTTLLQVLHRDDIGTTLADIYRMIAREIVTVSRETRFVKRSGETAWVMANFSTVADAEGAVMHFILQAQDVTERKRAEERLHHAAFYDALTGLPNRPLFIENLGTAIRRTQQYPDHLVAMLFLDLDRFKNINDSLGHIVGDQLLNAVAKRLAGSVRPTDMVSRFGGDEFAVMLNGVDSVDEVVEIAERILASIARPFKLSGYEVVTSSSMGITLSTIGYANTEDFLRDADMAMYRAKERGKGRFEIFDTYMHARAMTRLQLENDLHYALEREEFEVYYQPIVDLPSGGIAGFEALIRWNHPEKGLVSPADFIPVAEDTDMIIPIGEWILRSACETVKGWQDEFGGPEPVTVSVNLSGKQFKQPDLVARIESILNETGLQARSLRLEITESAVMDDAEAAREMLRSLRRLGVQVSIDDFGTGYSSLSYLHKFPANILKIDQSFVARMIGDDEALGIVETIITLASRLKMSVVAEGIETAEQLDVLKEFGCDYGQGYHFAKPLQAAAAEAMLRDSTPLFVGRPVEASHLGNMLVG